MLGLVKPEGKIIFSLSEIAENDHGFGEIMAELENGKQWSRVDESRKFRTYPFSEKAAYLRHFVYVYQKT